MNNNRNSMDYKAVPENPAKALSNSRSFLDEDKTPFDDHVYTKSFGEMPLDEESLSFVGEKPHKFKRPKKTMMIELAIWAAVTAYTIALWIIGKGKNGYAFYTLVYILFSLRILARHFSISYYLYDPVGRFWNRTVGAAASKVPSKLIWAGVAGVTLAIMLVMALVSKSEDSDIGARLQSFSGVIVLLALCYACSKYRRAVDFQVVAVGLALQYAIALFVLRTALGRAIFQWLTEFVTNFLNYSSVGAQFILGDNLKNTFAINVFPAIIFFCAFIQIVYYFGGMQYIVEKMAAVVCRVLNTSGAESVVASASPFIGQGESALLVKPFVEFMTVSELHAVMTSGFATISGSVLLGFTDIVEDTSALLTSCMMSIPCSLLVSKLRYPETEESLTKGKIEVPDTDEEPAVNFLHAAGNGAATGAHLVILIGASILALVSLYQAANELVGWVFDMINVHQPGVLATELHPHAHWISVEYILSFVFFPFAWMIGIPLNDCRKSAEIMAIKMLVNEFTAYKQLFDASLYAFSPRSLTLMTYALCGFANVGSIGIQVGCLGALAPKRQRDIATIAVSAMLTGTVSTWLSAAVAGTLL